jgi:hypothetical protein
MTLTAPLASTSSSMSYLARASQIWQIRVLTAKLRRLLRQAVPVAMLVMQVIDETNHAGTLFRRTSRLLVPIYGNSAATPRQLRGRAKWAADERG